MMTCERLFNSLGALAARFVVVVPVTIAENVATMLGGCAPTHPGELLLAIDLRAELCAGEG